MKKKKNLNWKKFKGKKARIEWMQVDIKLRGLKKNNEKKRMLKKILQSCYYSSQFFIFFIQHAPGRLVN